MYPDIFWGTISSSGVTKAIYDYWAYYEPVAQYGPPACISAQKTMTHIVDNILIGKNNSRLTSKLKSAFQLGNLTYNDDFANQLAEGVSWWQSLNWDPAVSSPEFFNYCNNISSTKVLYPTTERLRSTAAYLIDQGGYPCNSSLVNQFLNYIGYVNFTQVAPCTSDGSTLDECFSNHNASFYAQDDLGQQGWRSWSYQYCSEWVSRSNLKHLRYDETKPWPGVSPNRKRCPSESIANHFPHHQPPIHKHSLPGCVQHQRAFERHGRQSVRGLRHQLFPSGHH